MNRLFPLLSIALVCFATLPAAAGAAEVKLAGEEIRLLLTDATLYAGEDGGIEQIFQKSGQTVYIDHGNASQGTWDVEGDAYCSVWPPSAARDCYSVFRDGLSVTFVSQAGDRYPMRLTK